MACLSFSSVPSLLFLLFCPSSLSAALSYRVIHSALQQPAFPHSDAFRTRHLVCSRNSSVVCSSPDDVCVFIASWHEPATTPQIERIYCAFAFEHTSRRCERPPSRPSAMACTCDWPHCASLDLPVAGGRLGQTEQDKPRPLGEALAAMLGTPGPSLLTTRPPHVQKVIEARREHARLRSLAGDSQPQATTTELVIPLATPSTATEPPSTDLPSAAPRPPFISLALLLVIALHRE